MKSGMTCGSEETSGGFNGSVAGNMPPTGPCVGLGNGLNVCVTAGFADGWTAIPPGPVPLAVEPGVNDAENVDVTFVGIADESGMETPVDPMVPDAVNVDVNEALGTESELARVELKTVDSLGALAETVPVRLTEVKCEGVDSTDEAVTNELVMFAMLSGSEGVAADASRKHVCDAARTPSTIARRVESTIVRQRRVGVVVNSAGEVPTRE